MLRKVCGIGVAVIGLLPVSGCVIDGSESGANATVENQIEQYIDLDNSKEHPLGLIFGMPEVDDRLDYNSGDREDWRYIVVTEPGMMTISLNLDTPKDIKGSATIVDSEGRMVRTQPFIAGQGFYEFRDIPVTRGIFYFQTLASEGKSIYTIAASYRATPTVAAYTPPPPPPQPVYEEEEYEPDPPPKVNEPRRNPRPSKPSKTSGSSGGSHEPKKPPKEEASSGGTRLVGNITVMTPKADGSYEVTIRNVGKDKGVESGAIGTIEGTSIKIETTQCFATSCRALIPESANPKSLKKGANVIFKVN
jgi:hypothetical protein